MDGLFELMIYIKEIQNSDTIRRAINKRNGHLYQIQTSIMRKLGWYAIAQKTGALEWAIALDFEIKLLKRYMAAALWSESRQFIGYASAVNGTLSRKTV
jgi:hypothetical protein